jgi:signal transduction histidine kinase/ActR/RegA family two-component response regulator
MRLSNRLVLLVLGCLIPILTAQIYAEWTLRDARRARVNSLILHQAELATATLGRVVDEVVQLSIVVTHLPEVAAAGPGCEERLTSLRRDLSRYRFLAVYQTGGELLCGSAGTPGGSPDKPPPWVANLAATKDIELGPLISPEIPDAAFLPVGIYLPTAVKPDSHVLLAALDAGRLAERLNAALPDHTGPLAHTAVAVVDRVGGVMARPGDAEDIGGQPALREWARLLATRHDGETSIVTDPRARTYLAAYVPAANGLAVMVTVPRSDVTADIDYATCRDLGIVGGAALMALILAWTAGHRFIYRPAEALLLAARKWRGGDLSARAILGRAGAEFSALARSFNAMAAGLQAREMERRLQSSFLEAQVAERTRELSDSNNRLQVEIAGREKTEAALHQAQKLQAVGQLAGGIAHDFNNMLATVLGNLELMERRVAQTDKHWTASDTERLLRLIGRATGAVQRGSQLTSRLLAFSRRQRLAARSTDVNALLRELITLATSTLGRRVQVASDLGDELWPAMVDPSQVEAAILNLCLNARDAMPDGGRLTISTANLLSTEAGAAGDAGHNGLPPGGYVQICISDTGIGMTADVKARAFDPFFTTKGPHGSGLGLSQVYGMARQSGGDAVIDSTPGRGTRVTLFLPRATPSEQAETEQAERAMNLASRVPMRADLVLVVDDDAAVRQVTVEMARDLGCDVAQATGGEQALELLGDLAIPPTLILLDYAMPGMNGLQLARALRERGVSAPIALVTGYAELSEADVAEARLAGMLRKPFTIGELHSLLVQLRATVVEPSSEACLEPGLAGSLTAD